MIIEYVCDARTSRSRGVSSTVGVVLLLGMVVIGTTSVAALGSVALEETERQSTLERAEQSMAQFDSRAAQVALGEETSQRLSFGYSSGNYRVIEDEGSITITHANHDGGSDDDGNRVDDGPGDDDEDIYSGLLGTVVYENGDTEIAYQGGGVWRYQDGTTRMVSPPEFHYEGSTLTLPVVHVSGGASASGSPTAVVTRKSATEAVYPNRNSSYADNSSVPYLNPASDGDMIVTVQSKYYEGWQEYFESRTEGSVIDVNSSTNTVTAELVTLGRQGEFDIPTTNDPFEVRGLESSMESGKGLADLSFTLRPNKKKTTNKFASLDWSLYAQSGNQRLALHLGGVSNGECDNNQRADLTIYYSDDGGNTYHGWVAEDAYLVECEQLDGDDTDDGEAVIKVNLVDSGSPPTAEYQSISGKLANFNPSKAGGSLASSVTFDHFEGDSGTTYSTGGDNDETVDVLVKHYFNHFAPRFDLQSADGNNGNSVNEGDSTGDNIQYTGDDVITFLHVSENEVEVTFE